jgi:hypothetical protein
MPDKPSDLVQGETSQSLLLRTLMAQTVGCDICGTLFGLSPVKSHRRLAHPGSDLSGSKQPRKSLRCSKVSRRKKGFERYGEGSWLAPVP